jgi:hypothetical protein
MHPNLPATAHDGEVHLVELKQRILAYLDDPNRNPIIHVSVV